MRKTVAKADTQTSEATAATERAPLLGIPKAVLPIYLTTFVDTLGYTLLIPLLPAIAKQFGAADWLVGMLLSVPAACATVAAPIWGKTSDKTGRKFVILVAQGFTLCGYLILALAPTFSWIFLSRIISGVGAGSIGAAESYIADVTTEQERERSFALYGAVFGSAFVIGPVMAGFLQRYGLQFPFFVAAALEVVNIVFTIFVLPSLKSKRKERTSVKASVEAAWKPSVRSVLIRQFLFIFAVVFLIAAFALYLDHVLHESVAHASWLLAGAGAIGGITLVAVVTPLTKRIGERAVGQIGFVLLFAAYGLIFFVRSIDWFFPVLVLWAAGAAMVEPTLMTVLSKRAPKEERGAIMGVSDSVNSIAMIFAPAMGAAVVGAAPRLLGVLPAIAVAGAFFLGRRKRAADGEPSAPDTKTPQKD